MDVKNVDSMNKNVQIAFSVFMKKGSTKNELISSVKCYREIFHMGVDVDNLFFLKT